MNPLVIVGLASFWISLPQLLFADPKGADGVFLPPVLFAAETY
jgi:hypothetical protein